MVVNPDRVRGNDGPKLAQLVQEFGRDLPDKYGVSPLLHQLIEQCEGLACLTGSSASRA